MRKNKIFLALIVLMGIFAFNISVKADEIVGYTWSKLEFNIYNEETKQFEKQEDMGSINFKSDGNGIYSSLSLKKGDEVYVIDGKMLLAVPKKEGYYFTGWYLDEELTKPLITYKVDKKFQDLDLKLYGKWTTEQLKTANYVYGVDVYKVTLLSSCSTMDGCFPNSEYIYMAYNDYMENEKGKISVELPTLKRETTTSVGWCESTETIKNSAGYDCAIIPKDEIESNKIKDLMTLKEAEDGHIEIIAKWGDNDYYNEIKKECEKPTQTVTPEPTATPEPTSDPTTTGTSNDNINEDIAPPVVPSEKKADSTKYLYIGLASGGIALVLLIVAFAVNNKKSKKVVKQEIATKIEENKDIENKE